MRVLVTGGTGYIGAHIVVELAESYDKIHVIDDLSNSSASVVENLKQIVPQEKLIFHQGDIRDTEFLKRVFENQFDAVIHLAAKKAVGESMSDPLLYYDVNVRGTLNLVQAMRSARVNKLIFSSTACVYKETLHAHTENDIIEPENVYGQTKLASEIMIKDYARSNPEFKAVILRYFNAVGAHPCGLIGENPRGIPNNLLPFIQRVATGALTQLNIFGSDYNTPDGTAIRDYIHVVDLAKGHISALQNISPGVKIYNLGTGKGSSVKEVVDAYEAVIGRDINKQIVGRRQGDVDLLVANPSKANQELGWKSEKTLHDICEDDWRFASNSSRLF